jgi:hypothetical protein
VWIFSHDGSFVYCHTLPHGAFGVAVTPSGLIVASTPRSGQLNFLRVRRP